MGDVDDGQHENSRLGPERHAKLDVTGPVRHEECNSEKVLTGLERNRVANKGHPEKSLPRHGPRSAQLEQVIEACLPGFYTFHTSKSVRLAGVALRRCMLTTLPARPICAASLMTPALPRCPRQTY